MRKYIIGNWKCNKSYDEVLEWASAVEESGVVSSSDHLQVVLCASFLYLPLLKEKVASLKLGAQTVSPFSNGAYTGAVSAQQVAQYAQFALLGHAERAKYFGETDQVVAQQALQALDAGLTPIIAVDDSNWAKRLTQLDPQQLERCIVMYEPPGAISTAQGGRAVEFEEVISAIDEIRRDLKPAAVLYGGSVSPANVGSYVSHPSIDGVVPGAASLNYQDFIELMRNVQAAIPSS
jgi:triosephosphate isomerase (TIM)